MPPAKTRTKKTRSQKVRSKKAQPKKKARTKETEQAPSGISSGRVQDDSPSIAISSILRLLEDSEPWPFDDDSIQAVLEFDQERLTIQILPAEAVGSSTRIVLEWTIDGNEYYHMDAERSEEHFSVALPKDVISMADGWREPRGTERASLLYVAASLSTT